jgi:hypothetical protein
MAWKKLSPWIRRLIWAGALLLVYTVTGFFIVPAIIKAQLLKRLPPLTHRQVALEQVKFNPYVLSLTLRGFALKEPGGDAFVSFDELYVNFQLSSIFKRKWVFAEVSLKEPFAQVTYRADGNFNFSDLLTNSPAVPPPPPAAHPPAQSMPAVLIYRLSITNGAVAFADLKRKTPFRTRFSPIQLDLDNFTTVRDEKSPYAFTAHSDSGEVFSWSGQVAVNPVKSSGKFRIGGLSLPAYHPYSQDYAKFELAHGTLDVAADYHLAAATNGLDAGITNGVVQLNQLELKTPDTGETAVKIPVLAVKGIWADLASATAGVDQVQSSGGFLLVRRNKDNSLNLLSQLIPPSGGTDSAAAKPPNAAPAWSARIAEITFENYSLKIEDRAPERPASFDVTQLAFTLKDVSNASNAPVSAAVALRFQENGAIRLDGSLTLMPPSADLKLDITNLDLRAGQSYVEPFARLAIGSGTFDLQGRARYHASGDAGPMMSFAGDLAVNHFLTTDEVLFKEFAKWDKLAVTGINFAMKPDKMDVGEVRFDGLNASVVIGPDKRPNLKTILVTPPASEAAAAPAGAGQKPPQPDITLGALVLENSAIHFSDESIEPHCAFDVQEFGGSIRGLSSQMNTTADVDMKGRVDAGSPFSVTGKVNPLAGNLFADVSVAFTNTQLTAFTPYTEKFAGRPLQKGKLSFAVHYLVQQNALKAENAFFVDQLTLGPRNNSPDATKLPVKLAVALLKDRNGRIRLDVPVQGRTDDPKFRIGPIIWQVVENLMVKAAASPFTLLGSMFGGGEELSYVDFAPGESAILDSETNKLNTLTKALYERPELTMEIRGSADPARDRDALARTRLRDQVRALWMRENMSSNQAPATAAMPATDSEAYSKLVRELFEQAFPSTNATTAANLPLIPGTNSAVAPPQMAAAPPARGIPMRTHDVRKGATFLMRPSPVPESAAPSGGVVAQERGAASLATNALAAAQAPQTALGVPEMEARLLGSMVVSDDDVRDLMRARASRVQEYLLRNQQVTADRLFVIAPQPVNATFQGQCRADLSLD